jgi:hypothetical protein
MNITRGEKKVGFLLFEMPTFYGWSFLLYNIVGLYVAWKVSWLKNFNVNNICDN